MKTIEERADEYIYKMDCSEWTGVEDYARHGYKQGATDEHYLLTEWHDPKDMPKDGREVLVKYYSNLFHRESYAVVYFQYGTFISSHEMIDDKYDTILGWREIHE